ncbi:MAG: DUF362 domain-containing protein [Candidatus Lokiarchaeota archaeon]|nr:DUF362 domain-containing protein [Candidatus Lokiarchaeota archaeon]
MHLSIDSSSSLVHGTRGQNVTASSRKTDSSSSPISGTTRKYPVIRHTVRGSLRSSIEKAIGQLGGFERFVTEGDIVTLKPNLNTADPYPASSDPEFIREFGSLILEAGAKKIRIVESSMFRLDTREVAEKVGLADVVEELEAELVILDEHDWPHQKFSQGQYMKGGQIGGPALIGSDRLFLVPCLKTHKLAGFTGAMKLLIGWVRGRDRIRMHIRKLQEKIADLASFFTPDLVMMDARKVFVTGGPASGTIEEPGQIITGDNMLSVDVEGVKLLQSYKADNSLGSDVWAVPQIKHAARIGIGPKSDQDIIVHKS